MLAWSKVFELSEARHIRIDVGFSFGQAWRNSGMYEAADPLDFGSTGYASWLRVKRYSPILGRVGKNSPGGGTCTLPSCILNIVLRSVRNQEREQRQNNAYI